MTWNPDISKAPHGKYVVQEVPAKNGKVSTKRVFVKDVIWAASKCGKVTLSHFIASENRWEMFGTKEKPIAWRPFDPAEFPFEIVGEGRDAKRVYLNGDRPAHPFAEASA